MLQAEPNGFIRPTIEGRFIRTLLDVFFTNGRTIDSRFYSRRRVARLFRLVELRHVPIEDAARLCEIPLNLASRYIRIGQTRAYF
jgi:hypothetical protein